MCNALVLKTFFFCLHCCCLDWTGIHSVASHTKIISECPAVQKNRPRQDYATVSCPCSRWTGVELAPWSISQTSQVWGSTLKLSCAVDVWLPEQQNAVWLEDDAAGCTFNDLYVTLIARSSIQIVWDSSFFFSLICRYWTADQSRIESWITTLLLGL